MEMFQTLSIILEIGPEDAQDPDPAAVNAFAHNVTSALQHDGYAIQPIYTGQRGGLELLFQIIVSSIQTVSSALVAQKDAIDVLGALCTIFATVKDPVMRLFHGHKKQAPQEHEIKVRVKIDNAEVEITSADIADDERIVKLVERFYALHPQVKPTPQSTVKIQARIPKQKPRQRR